MRVGMRARTLEVLKEQCSSIDASGRRVQGAGCRVKAQTLEVLKEQCSSIDSSNSTHDLQGGVGLRVDWLTSAEQRMTKGHKNRVI